IGYMSQKFSLYDDLNMMENIRFFGGIYGLDKKTIEQRTNELIEKFSMQDMQKKLIKDIPLGWKQKIAFSIAVLHKPKVVFLDEPTGGVDPITRRQFWDLINETAEMGITVFVTTHYMDEAEYCNRVSIMSEGKIIELGKPKDLKEKHQVNSIDELFFKVARNVNY
ncbi:MAG TPA: ABC transporter ATP-binding protein, partial [Bacteroidales bacterium]